MEYLFSIPLPDGFSLRDTLLCGQCFRWNEQEDGSFYGWAGEKSTALKQEGNTLFLSDPDLPFWKNYLDLDQNYEKWKQLFLNDPSLSQAVRFCGGIRILRQDPWESLISFIISANNNIPRIKGIIERLCLFTGKKDGSFPSPEMLASLSIDDLSPLRAGFRAKYILDAAKKIASGAIDLKEINKMPLDQARCTLRIISGVGPKVAECVLLYGFHRLNAFPVDTWIKKVLDRLYPGGFPRWIIPGGLAQQYLFHYVRNIPSALETNVYPLSEKGRRAAFSLFKNTEETLILSALEGVMGAIAGDDPDAPKCVRIILGDFSFFAGNSDSPASKELLMTDPAPILAAGNEEESAQWESLFTAYFPQAQKSERYAIKKEGDIFDRKKLTALSKELPEGFSIQPIHGKLIDWCRTEIWAQDFVSNFPDNQAYEELGLGFLVLDAEGNPAAGASSYSVYSGGIEIEVDTKKEFRRKGLAAAVCAQLILTALEKGLYPSWDAANLISVHLSEKLGYHFDRPYSVWIR